MHNERVEVDELILELADYENDCVDAAAVATELMREIVRIIGRKSEE
jgi:hypothetical protein